MSIVSYIKELFQKPKPRNVKVTFKDILFFFSFVKPLWKIGTISLFLTLILGALSSVFPLGSKIFIDFVILKQGTKELEVFLKTINLDFLTQWIGLIFSSVNYVIFIIIGITLISSILGIIQQFITIRFQQEITFNLQTALFDHVLRFPISFFKDNQVGYVMSRVSGDVSMVQSFFCSYIPQFLTNGFYMLFSFGILFSLNQTVSIILISIFPIWAGIIYFFSSRVRSISYGEMEKQAEISKDIQETLSGVEVIKTHVSEQKAVDNISAKIRSLFHIRIKNSILQSLSGYFIRFCKLLMLLLIIWFSVHEIEKGKMSIGDMIAILSYVMKMSGMANTFSSNFMMLQIIFTSMERLLEMFSVKTEYENEKTSNKLIRLHQVNEIRFDQVSFSYDKHRTVLDDLNFTVKTGDVVALIGNSGAGKTTLINQILKFYTPDTGKILIDNFSLNDIDTRWWRKKIGFVSQDVFLFNDTIQNNIKYGNPSANEESVIQAAKIAQINDFIESLENGYQTMVGERGVKLSAGQRQRISIARAFLISPAILIFDEPTSALDSETENSLNITLKKLTEGRITFIISHRMKITEIANRIFKLTNSKIIEYQNDQDLYLESQANQRRMYENAEICLAEGGK